MHDKICLLHEAKSSFAEPFYVKIKYLFDTICLKLQGIVIMKIDNDLLQKLEKLSMLKIKDKNREEIIKDLSNIVNFVENLNELDLEKEEATFTTIQGGTPMRKDSPAKDPEIIKNILKNAPKSEDNFFVVPKIIE